jgi:hypothetical protein
MLVISGSYKQDYQNGAVNNPLKDVGRGDTESFDLCQRGFTVHCTEPIFVNL